VAPPTRQRQETATHLVVTQVRSAIGSKPKHRGTLRALGLRRIGHRSVLPDRPEIRGMIARVPHLVSVAPATPEDTADEGARR
jgi:large subunit ribosomal protein L30